METSTSQIDAADLMRMAGGPTAVAKAIGLGQSAVSNWITRGRVPLEHAAAVAVMAGVDPEVVHPGVIWERNPDGRVISYRVPVSMPPTVDQPPSTAQPADAGAVEGISQ